MKVKWLGHASFLLTSSEGIRIITDPYTPGGSIKYGTITEVADIVTVSHEHGDHNYVASIQGEPQVIKGAVSKEAKGIHFRGIPTYHDRSGGRERGANTIFCFAMDDIRVCHLGDLGHPLTNQQLADLGEVDLLLIPVGGFFTIDASVATQLCDSLKPRVVIPMHCKTPKCDMPIVGVDKFLEGKANVRRLEAAEVEIKAEELPTPYEVVVLRPAL